MCIPKATGADIEFGNSIIGARAGLTGITSWDACNRMLAEAPGWRSSFSTGFYPAASSGFDWGRYGLGLSSVYGGETDHHDDEEACTRPVYAATMFRDYGRCWSQICLYLDMGHIEGCLPITRSCYDHVAALNGLYNVIAQMRRQAVGKLPEGQDLFVTINNTDGSVRTSYGAHFNVMVARRFFDTIFHRKPHVLGFLASALAALTPLFGQGHILCRNGKPPVFTLSQRAHHLGVLVSPSTTTAFRRPLINSRDESHGGADIARLHLINFDASLAQYAVLFRVWFVQSLLASMEASYYDPRLMLDDPLQALKVWSQGLDPGSGRITPVCARVGGGDISLVELLEGITEGIDKAYSSGRFNETIVPDYKRVFPKWVSLLKALREGDMTACARHLDWALKFSIIDREMDQTGHDLDAPEIRILDQLYSHVDREVGLYWAFESSGFVERCVSEPQVALMQTEGPDNTRAYTRRRILEKFGDDVVSVDWGEIRVRVPNAAGTWTTEKRIVLDDPLGFTKADMESLLNAATSVRELCAALEGNNSCTVSTFQKPGACHGPGPYGTSVAPSVESKVNALYKPARQGQDDPCAESGKINNLKEDGNHE